MNNFGRRIKKRKQMPEREDANKSKIWVKAEAFNKLSYAEFSEGCVHLP